MGVFKTPGRLRGAKTPRTICKSAFKTAKKAANELTKTGPGNWIAPIEVVYEETPVITQPIIQENAVKEPETIKEASPEKHEVVIEDLVDEQEVLPQPSPERSPVRLYTESDIGSPSVNDTPEQPARKGSFSFASLPPREPLKQSLGAPLSAIKQTTTRQQSLGLDSDEIDGESVDLRAPELIAHEQRMKEYDTPAAAPAPVQMSSPPSIATSKPELATEVPAEMPGMYPAIESLEEEIVFPTPPAQRRTRSSIKRKAEEVDDSTPEQVDEEIFGTVDDGTTAVDTSKQTNVSQKSLGAPVRQSSIAPASTRADRSKLRAPKPLGRPVRPTTAATRAKLQPQPVSIKVKSLATKPINNAPVAAQELVRPMSTQPELRKQNSIQSVTGGNTTFNKSTTKAPVVPSKVFSLAQKKKEHDERAAAKDAAVKQQQKERRDNKI